MNNKPGIKIRPATLGDFEAIDRVRKRNDLASIPRDEWTHIHSQHPLVEYPDSQIGWVLVTQEGEIVGVHESIRLAYEFDGKPVAVACSSSFAVNPDHRHASALLMAKFFAQRDIDLFIATTANEASGTVWQIHRGQTVPGPYDEVAMWVTRPVGFASAALRLKNIPGVRLAGPIAGTALALRRLARGPSEAQAKRHPDVQEVTSFDRRFDEFWQTLRSTRRRLMAPRSATCLSWHFAHSFKRGGVCLAIVRNDRIEGYAFFRRNDCNDIGLRRLQMVDLQLENENASEARLLIEAALDLAKRQNVHLVEAYGFCAEKHGLFSNLAKDQRRFPFPLFFYRTKKTDLSFDVDDAAIWDPAPYDGDGGF